MHISKILVATDLGPSSDEAVRQAYAFAKDTGAELIACQVISHFLRSSVLFPQEHEREALGAVALERAAASAVVGRVAMLTGLDPTAFRVVVDIGAVDASIVRRTEDVGADLCVVGARSLSGL